MRSSEPTPGDESQLEQEPIWEGTADETADEPVDTPGPAVGGEAPSRGSGLAQSITSTARIPGPAGLYYADVPNRIIAMIVDIIVLSLIGAVLSLNFGGLVTDPGALDTAGGQLDVVPFLVVFLLQLAISFAYFGYCWVVLGGTLGMKLLGLRVGDEADGAAIDPRQAAVRWLILGIPSMLGTLGAYVPSLLGVLLTVIGFAWLAMLLYTIAGSPTKQGLHDRYARTIVVKSGRRAS